MKSESGSALQKAIFIVLLLVLGCLAYLVMREHNRSEPGTAEFHEATTPAAGPMNPPGSTEAPTTSPARPTYAPLRPRVETNLVRVVTNRVPVVLRTNLPALTETETPGVPVRGVFPGVVAVPVAYLSGARPGSPGTSVYGRATLRGVPPPEKIIALDAACGRLTAAPITTRHYVVGPDGGLANVFVYLKTGAIKAGPQDAVPVLDNVKCEFQPYVLGVRVGQPFNIRNSDPVLMKQMTDGKPSPAEDLYTNQTDPYFRAPYLYVAVAAPMASSGTAKTAAATACVAPNLLQDGVCVAPVVGEVAVVAAPLPVAAALATDAPVAAAVTSRAAAWAPAVAPAKSAWPAPTVAAKIVPVPKSETAECAPAVPAPVVAPVAASGPVVELARVAEPAPTVRTPEPNETVTNAPAATTAPASTAPAPTSTPLTSAQRNAADIARSLAEEAADRARDLANR